MRKQTHTQKRLLQQSAFYVLGTIGVVGSFALGIQSAGDVTPIAPLEAHVTTVTGDMNGNGILDPLDVAEILEVVQGYEQPTPEQLASDPNADGQLTIDDALRLLHDLAAL